MADKIYIDQERIDEYEAAKDWTPELMQEDWIPPEKILKDEEPPLQWLLDDILPFLLGGGAGATYAGRKELTKQGLKALNRLRGAKPTGTAISGVPIYDKAGKVIGFDHRTVPGRRGISPDEAFSPPRPWKRPSPGREALDDFGIVEKRWKSPLWPPGGKPIPIQERGITSPFGVRDNYFSPDRIFKASDQVKFLTNLPKEAINAYRDKRIRDYKKIADQLKDMITKSEKVKRTKLKDFPLIDQREHTLKMLYGDAGRYGIPQTGTGQEYKAIGHAVESLKRSNPELQKKTTDRVLDWLLKIDK